MPIRPQEQFGPRVFLPEGKRRDGAAHRTLHRHHRSRASHPLAAVGRRIFHPKYFPVVQPRQTARIDYHYSGFGLGSRLRRFLGSLEFWFD